MKIILLQNIKGVGKKGDIMEVSDGYAQNALLPKGLAKQATEAVVNNHKQAISAIKNKKDKLEKATLEKLRRLNTLTLNLEEKLNEKGNLYHGIGIKEISRAVDQELKVQLEDSLYSEKYSLKESGPHTINLEAYGKKSSFTLNIKSK